MEPVSQTHRACATTASGRPLGWPCAPGVGRSVRTGALLATLILLPLGGCGAEPATVAFRVLWPDDPNAPEQVVVQGRVRLAGGDAVVEGQPTGPISFGEPIRLGIGEVPNGVGHVFEVEVALPETPSIPLYFGRSSPFDLEPGQRETEVTVSLRRRPAAPEDGLTLEGRPEVVSNPEVTLVLRSDTAATVELSNRAGLVEDVTEIDLRGLSTARECPPTAEPPPASLCEYRLVWNLEQGLAPCLEQNACSRAVFGRFIDAGGLASTPLSTTVRLDTRPPGVELATIDSFDVNGQRVPTSGSVADRGRVIVTLVFDEIIDTRSRRPRLTASNGQSVMNFAPIEDAPGLVATTSFEVYVDRALHSDGTYMLEVTAEDATGNLAEGLSFLHPPLVVDATADELIVVQELVSYIRSPVGNASQEVLRAPDGSVAFVLPTGPYSELGPSDGLDPVDHLPPDAFRFADDAPPSRVNVWASRELEPSDLLASAQPNVDGAWPRQDLTWSRTDLLEVFVTGEDASGNQSTPVRIDSAWWVGSSARPGVETRPHAVSVATELGPPLVSRVLQDDVETLDGRDGIAERVKAEPRWRPHTGPAPAARSGTALAYDAARGEAVLFGGRGESGRLADTWTWDGVRWTEVTPVGRSPPSREDHKMAYDAARGRVVLFGGDNDSVGGLSDTWEWDGASWERRSESIDRELLEHQLAYDAAKREVLLVARVEAGLTAVMAWDGSNWRELPTTGERPPARSRPIVGYDRDRSRLIVAGGGRWQEVGPSQFQWVPFVDTWEWDGQRWTDVTASVGPVPRVAQKRRLAAWNGACRCLVAVGSFADGDQTQLDVLAFDGTAWTLGVPMDESAFDLVSASWTPTGEVVLVGTDTTTSADGMRVWLGGPEEWRNLDLSRRDDEPPLRSDEGGFLPGFLTMAYDEAEQQLVLINEPAGSSTPNPRTWSWDGRRWRLQPLVPPTPSLTSIVYDSIGQRLLGLDPDRGTWARRAGVWMDLGATGPSSAFFSSLMVFDEGQGRAVVVASGFRPLDPSITWTFTSSVWRELGPGGPLRRAMAYDPARDQVVVFGGFLSGRGKQVAGTWVLEGETWREVTPAAPADSPPPRQGATMVYDPDRREIVLFGGTSDGTPLADTWAWGGLQWTQLAPNEPAPEPRHGRHVMAYDEGRRQLLLFGGGDDSSNRNTWELAPAGRPSIQLEATLDANIDPSRVADIRVRAGCGGDSPEGSGVELVGWTSGGVVDGVASAPGDWRSLAQSTANVDATAWLEFAPSESNAIGLARSLVGKDGRVFVQCRPIGTSDGPQAAIVAADYFEVRVKYTLAL